MFADLGFYLLRMCTLLSLYGVGASILAALWRHRRLYRSARIAATSALALCFIAAALQLYMFYQRDYSVAYIAKNSSNDLPAMYTLTAFWSSLEGSHFLWTLLMSLFCVIAHWTASKDNENIMPYVSMSLQAVLAWMYWLATTVSDPFVRMLPAPPNGQGMNTLLQNPYMAIHPPTLFVGYTALSIPCAYAVAALCYGDITEGWLKTTRRWALFAFCALTAGIFLGGRWAYVELGWSGYWAWDPVENSSFIPWLFCTALVHSLLVQDRLGQLKRLSILLAFFAFFFSFFGTFLTRSNIISSVHSFAESEIGPNYLLFLSGMLAPVLGLYLFRGPSILPANTGKVWGVSKESALVITQFLLLTFAAIVCIGTLFPIVSEALTKQRVSIQAPYFNTFAPFLGLGFALTIAVGNLMRFQSGKITGGPTVFLKSLVVALAPAAMFIYFGDIMRTTKPFNLAAQIIGVLLTFWAINCLSFDLYYRVKNLNFRWKQFFHGNRGYLGAYLAHVGFLIALLGFLGNYRGLVHTATLQEGQTTSFAGYEFKLNSLRVYEQENAQVFGAQMDIYKDGAYFGHVEPGRSKYPTKDELMHEVGVNSSFWRDIYAVLSDFDRQSGKSATVEIHVNATVRLVWISCVIMVLGAILALFDRFRGNRGTDSTLATWRMEVQDAERQAGHKGNVIPAGGAV